VVTVHAVISPQIQKFLHPESQIQEFPVSLNNPTLPQFNNDKIAYILRTCATIFKAISLQRVKCLQVAWQTESKTRYWATAD